MGRVCVPFLVACPNSVYLQTVRSCVAVRTATNDRLASDAAVTAGRAVYMRSTLSLPERCETAQQPGSQTQLVAMVNGIRSDTSKLAGVFTGDVVEAEFEATRQMYQCVWEKRLTTGQTLTDPRQACLKYYSVNLKTDQFVPTWGTWEDLKRNAVALLQLIRDRPHLRSPGRAAWLEDDVFNAKVSLNSKAARICPYPPYGPKVSDVKEGGGPNATGIYASTMEGTEEDEGGSNLLVSDGVSSNTSEYLVVHMPLAVPHPPPPLTLKIRAVLYVCSACCPISPACRCHWSSAAACPPPCCTSQRKCGRGVPVWCN
jgi:hypothetical protein